MNLELPRGVAAGGAGVLAGRWAPGSGRWSQTELVLESAGVDSALASD